MKKSTFTEMANTKIGAKRNAVISKLDDGSFTIGQQIEVKEEETGKTLNISLKGALHASNIEGLQNLRDAINVVLKKETKK